MDLQRPGGNHRNSGLIEVTVGRLAVSGVSIENSGEVRVLAGATFALSGAGLVNAANGLLSGTGTFDFSSAATVANGGTVAPGASPGTLGVTGDYPQSAGGTLAMEIGGFTPGLQHDRLAVSGAAQLGGTIRAILVNGFSPTKDDAFTVLTYASRNGSFATVQSAEPERIAWRVQYNATSAQLIVANKAPTLANIANQTVNELAFLSITATSTDPDLPANVLTYSLQSAPTGMTIDSTSGLITWTPTEAQGPGVHNVTVRVTDNGLPVLTHTTSFTVTVNELNVAPQLVLPAPQTVGEQVQLAFTINATDADLPANTLTYEMLSGPAGATFNPTTREFRWTPTEAQGPGSFSASFRVTDNNPDAVNPQQLSATGDVTITVNEGNLPPALATIGNQTVSEQTLLSLTATATDLDLPANVLTYSLDTAPSGMTIDSTSGLITWTPTEAQGPGVHNVTVRVMDNGLPALTHTTSFSVTVNEVNLAPTLVAAPDAEVSAGNTFSATLSATDPDLPANGLTFSLVSGPAGATVSPAGVVNWTAPLAAAGTVANFSVRVTDNGTPALADTRAFAVTVTEPAFIPVLVLPGSQTVDEQTELVFTITATHPTQPVSALTFALVSGPTGATFNPATREFRWTPTEAQGPGAFTATFRVTESVEQLSATGDVNLTVNEVNLAPALAVIGNQSIDEQTLLSLSATATDSDLPANALTYSLDTAPSGMTINPTSGLLTWTPTEAQGPGVQNVTVRVTDNGIPALTHTTSFSVAVDEVNLPPVLTQLGNKTTDEQVLISIDATAIDADMPGNALIYSLDSAPSGMTIDASSGVITWIPTESQGPGVHNVTVRVKDNGSPALTDTVSFSVTVNEVNLAPQLALPGSQTVYEQVELVFAINASDADLPANVLTYEMMSGPAGATFNPTTREFRWTPTGAQAPGTFSATFRVTDNNPDAVNSQQLSASGAVSLTVVEFPVLEYRFSELGSYLGGKGGCPIASDASFPLPAGNWANGVLKVKGLNLGIGEGLLYSGFSEDDGEITIDLNSDASNESIVALLRNIKYYNDQLTPDWFTDASDRYPRRAITITLTDATRTRVQTITRDVQFPYLTGLKIGRMIQNNPPPRPPEMSYHDSYVIQIAEPDSDLILGGQFSNGQFLRVERLETEWMSTCDIFGTRTSEFPSRSILGTGVQSIFSPIVQCCWVRARSGQLSAVVQVSFVSGSCFVPALACSPSPFAAASRLNQAQGNAVPEISLPAFYALQSLMKQTPEGQRLVDLYWLHTAEVLRLLFANSLLREQAASVFTTFQPGVAALLSGNGQSSPITQHMIDQLNVLWSALAAVASPALRTALEQERARFNNFQDFVNKDFSQWAGLLEIPAPTQPWIFISRATREGGRVTVECNDIPGTDLTLWRSGNLSSWEQVLNPEVSRSINTIRFVDPAPPAGSVFYQIRR